MSDAMAALNACEWSDPHGADADHLKTPDNVDVTAAAGFTFFTIDPSGHVDQNADNYDAATVEEKLANVREAVIWIDKYIGKTEKLPNGRRIEFDTLSVHRAAVKYGLAIQAALSLADYIAQVQERAGRSYEIELSVDETEQPTTLIEHYIIAEQCLQHGMRLVSLAPRFIGDFEKGVDFIGNLQELEVSLHDHAAIASHLGPYKLSLHSGSDKLAMYRALAAATQGRFHVKTAGTSYLEALRVVALEQPSLFREICEFSREHYEVDRATYHVHATLEKTPPPAEIFDDQKLQDVYLERWENVPADRGFIEPGRQILHCTFGSVSTHERLGPALRECLESHQDTYTEVLAEHFSRHLRALALLE